MTTGGAGRPQHPAGPAPTPAAQDPSGQWAQRLTRAAARSGAVLVAEAAALADGWAVLVDPSVGAVHSTPRTAGPDGERAAAHPQAHAHLTVRHVGDASGSVLVVGPGRTPGAHVALIAQATADLLRVRARRADDVRGTEQRLHAAVLNLLLHGQHALAVSVLGDGTATHATVYRLTGRTVHAAYQTLWRAAQPGAVLGGPRMLVCLEGTELVAVARHGGQDDHTSARTLITRIAERHQLAGGAAEPAPLDMFATAWAEAGAARHGATPGRLAVASGLGADGLLRVVPADRLGVWSAAVLRPLDREQRRTLEAWLRSGSALTAAPALDVSEGTVRARLRAAAALLAVDLDHPTVQAQLLLALRAPAAPLPVSTQAAAPMTAPVLPVPPARSTAPPRLRTDPPLPTELLSRQDAVRWASGLLEPLDTRFRITLRCWLRHRGRTAPAAAELGLHRSTLTAWLAECGKLLDLELSSATTRAELHLAVETTATPEEVPEALPRRGGRTYRGVRR
ncbi:helix-turn-helix domain-containing protein [Streptomyces flavofungini]|uniref:helix-turn-helix domain-containing protein n=1 Tax=Streptomyces flavofungini TaxID=68200 RepID=UPI0025AF0D94|nr:helix-turn-helix domain-containing protein [Streptomyces flavofungini]WJV50768.1 helix-turn-helix domain-containing protein [Streptomyces flavofungini]